MKRALVLTLAIWIAPMVAATGGPEDTARLAGTVLVFGEATAGVEIELWPRPGPALPLDRWETEITIPDLCFLNPATDLEAPLLPGPPRARTRSGEGGRFEFEDLEPGRYLLVATTPGGARVPREISIVGADGGEEVTIAAVEGPCVLRGRALFRDGRPFRGTVVVTYGPYRRPDDGGAEVAGAAICNAEGDFEIPGLLPGRVELTAVDAGRLRAPLGPVLLPAGNQVDIVVDEHLAVTAGRVVDPAGRPVGETRIFAVGTGPDRGGWAVPLVIAAAETDSEGRIEFPGPLAPRFRLHGSERFLPHAEPRGPAGEDLLLVAYPKPRIRGVVRRAEDGRPVAGVPVLARDRLQYEPFVATRSDEEGRFEIAAPDTDLVLAAWGRGFVPRDRSERALAYHLSPGEVREVDLLVEPAGRIRGRVLDPDGEPVAGVTIQGSEAPPGSDAAESLLRCGDEVESGPDGRFVIDFLPRGSAVSLWVPPQQGYAQLGTRTTGTDKDELPISLSRGEAAPRGRVILPAGARGGDFRVDFYNRADVDGRFFVVRSSAGVFRSSPGAIHVSGFVGEAFYQGEASLVEGEETIVRPKPAPLTHAFLFHVLDPDGRPVPGGEIDGRPQIGGAWIEGGRASWWDADRPPERRVEELTVEFHSFRDGRGRPLPFAPKVAGPFPPGVRTIRLEPGRVVAGQAVTPNGRPVQGLEVRAYTQSEKGAGVEYANALSDTDGRFRLVGLGDVPYRLSLSAPEAYVPLDPASLPRGSNTVRIEVTPKVAPRIRVADREGKPLPGAEIRIFDCNAGRPFVAGAICRTAGEDGTAVFPLLRPDRPLTLHVVAPDGGYLPHEDGSWRPADTEVRLRRARSLTGVVLDAAGSPVADATIFVRTAPGAPALPDGFSYTVVEGGYVLAAITDTAGRFEIEGLPDTTLEIFATLVPARGPERRSEPRTARPGEPLELHLR